MKTSFEVNLLNPTQASPNPQNNTMKIEWMDDSAFLDLLHNNPVPINKLSADPSFLTSVVNRIDQIFQASLTHYTALLGSRPQVLTNAGQELQDYHSKFSRLLEIIARNSSIFPKIPSVDCIVALLPICLDFNVLHQAMNIIFLKLNEPGLINNTAWIDANLPKICRYTCFLFQHFNLYSFYSIQAIDMLHDDPKYARYLQEKEQSPLSAQQMQLLPEYKNDMKFEALLTSKDKPSTSSMLVDILISKDKGEAALKDKDTLEIYVPSLGEKYPNEGHLWVCQQIIKEYELGWKEGTPLWEALAFKVRACLKKDSYNHRVEVIRAAIDALRVLICLQKLFMQKKEFHKYSEALPKGSEITAFTLDMFELFSLNGTPGLHQSIVRCLTAFFAALEICQNDFKNSLQQIKGKNSVLYTMLKDCVVYELTKGTKEVMEEQREGREPMQLDSSQQVPPTRLHKPKLLPLETASHPDFLAWLLNLINVKLTQACNEKEAGEQVTPHTQLYSYTGIINLLLRILETWTNEYYSYNVEAVHLVLDCLAIVMGNQSLAADLNIPDKLIQRACAELEALIGVNQEKKPKYQHFCAGKWQLIQAQDHLAIFNNIAKVLRSPLEGPSALDRGPLTQMVPVKVENARFIELLIKGIENGVIEEETLSLIVKMTADIVKLFPERLEIIVESKLIEAILKQAVGACEKKKESIVVVIHLVRMMGKKKEGHNIERKYEIVEKMLEKVSKWDNTVVGGGDSKPEGDTLSNIGKELGELLKDADSYREIIAKAVMEWIDTVEKHTVEFSREWIDTRKEGQIGHRERMEEEKVRLDNLLRTVISIEDNNMNEEIGRGMEFEGFLRTEQEAASQNTQMATHGTCIDTQTTYVDSLNLDYHNPEIPQQRNIFNYFGLSFMQQQEQEESSRTRTASRKPQDFDKRLKKAIGMVQNLCTVCPHLFIADESYRANLISRGIFESLFRVLSFPFLGLSEVSALSWVSACFKQIVTKLSSGEQEALQKRIFKELMTQMQELETITGSLTKIQDFSGVLSDKFCYQVRLKGLFSVATHHSSLMGVKALQLIGKLTYIEFLIDFLRYPAEILLNQQEIVELTSKLRALYILVVNQIEHEDCETLKLAVEEIETQWKKLNEQKKKKKVMKCIMIISASHLSTRYTYHHAITKLFRKISGPGLDIQSAQTCSDMVIPLIYRMDKKKLEPGDDITAKKESLWTLIKLYNSVTYLHEFLMNAHGKRLRSHPEFIMRIHKACGYNILLESLEEMLLYVEKSGEPLLNLQQAAKGTSSEEMQDSSDSKMRTAEEAVGIVVREALGLNLYKLAHIVKTLYLAPMSPNLEMKVDGKLVKEQDVKAEYFFGIYRDMIEQVKKLFKRMDFTLKRFYQHYMDKKIARNKERGTENREERKLERKNEERRIATPDEFFDNLGNAIDCVFDCLKRVCEIKKEMCPERGNGTEEVRTNREGREGIFSQFFRHSLLAFTYNNNNNNRDTEQQMARPGATEVSSETPHQEKIAADPQQEGKKYRVREVQRVKKNEFMEQVLKTLYKELEEHIFSNLLTFEGYETKTMEAIKFSTEIADSNQKKVVCGEIVVSAFKVFKHCVNKFWPGGQKFLEQFKAPASVMKTALRLTQKTLQQANASSRDFLTKLRILHTAMRWVHQFLPYFPFLEENFVRKSSVLGLLRFVHKAMRQVRKGCMKGEEPGYQDKVYEKIGSVFEGIVQLVFMIYKLKGIKETGSSSSSSGSNNSSTAPADNAKENLLQFTTQEKSEYMTLLTELLRDAWEVSQQENRSLLIGKDGIRMYLKLVNQVLCKDPESARLFVEKGGLKRLLSYKVDSQEAKKTDLGRDFTDLCINLVKSKALDMVNLECQLKACFWQAPSHKMKLRIFAEKFSEFFIADSQGTLQLIKQVCAIDNNNQESGSSRSHSRSRSRMGHEEEQKDDMRDSDRRDHQEDVTALIDYWRGIEPRGRDEGEESRERRRSVMILLRPEMEFSYIQGSFDDEDTEGKAEGAKVRLKRLLTLEEQKRSRTAEKWESTRGRKVHIMDYKAPRTCRKVIKTLVESIVSQINEEMVEGQNQEDRKQGRFYYVFSYPVIFQAVQMAMGKYPILTKNVLSQDVMSMCRTVPKECYLLGTLKEEEHVSFMRYFLQVVVLCTMGLFKNFLLGFCSKTSLIVDKDKQRNGYPTPHFYLFKRQMMKDIYQILKGLVGKEPLWLKRAEDIRLFCGISSILVNVLPLKDVAKIVWENASQEDFIGLYCEALKQAKTANNDATEKVISFIVEPLSILVQYNWYFANKQAKGEEVKSYDIWMPKEALNTTTSFADDWKRVLNVSCKKEEERRSPIFRFVEESEYSESSQEDEIASVSDDDDMIEDLQVSGVNDADSDFEEMDEERNEDVITEIAAAAENERSQRNRNGREERNSVTRLEREERTDLEPIEGREMEAVCEPEDEEDEKTEDERLSQEDQDTQMNIDTEAMSEEVSVADYEERTPSTGDQPNAFGNTIATSSVNNNTFISLNTLMENGPTNPLSSTLLNVASSTQPEIQRLNSAFQDRSQEFDQHLLASPHSLINLESPSTTPHSVYDSLYSRVRSLQTGHHTEESLRRPDYYESFFENPRPRNLLNDDAEGDSGLRIFRSLREFIGRTTSNQPSQLTDILGDLFSAIENGRHRTTISLGVPGFTLVGMGVITPLESTFEDAPHTESMRLAIPTFSTTIRAAQPVPPETNIDTFENRILEDFNRNSARRLPDTDIVSNTRRLVPRFISSLTGNVRFSDDHYPRPSQRPEPASTSDNPFESLRPRYDEPTPSTPAQRPQVNIRDEVTIEDIPPSSIDPMFLDELPVDLKQDITSINTAPQEETKVEDARNNENKQSENPDSFIDYGDCASPSEFLKTGDTPKPNFFSEFLNAIPEDLRKDITTLTSSSKKEASTQDTQQSQVREYSKAQEPAAAQGVDNTRITDNASFVARLNPEAREEVLSSSAPSFLATLTTNESLADTPSQATAQPSTEATERRESDETSRITSLFNLSPFFTSFEGLLRRLPAADMASNNQSVRATNTNLSLVNSELTTNDSRVGTTLNTTTQETAERRETSPAPRISPYLSQMMDRNRRETLLTTLFSSREQGLNRRQATTVGDTASNNHSSSVALRKRSSTHSAKSSKKKAYIPDEKAIETVLSLLYGNMEGFENFPLSLLRAFLSHSSTQYKVLHCLIFLLTHPSLEQLVSEDPDFPIRILKEKMSLEKNYSVVYQKVSLKILYILDHLTQRKAFSFFTTPIGQSKHKSGSFRRCLQSLVPFQNQMKELPAGDTPLLELIKLVKNPTIEGSLTHMKLLLSVIYNITKHYKPLLRQSIDENKGEQHQVIISFGPPDNAARRNSNIYATGSFLDAWGDHEIDTAAAAAATGTDNNNSSFSLNLENFGPEARNNDTTMSPRLSFLEAFERERGQRSAGARNASNSNPQQYNFEGLQLDKKLIEILCSCLWNPNVEDDILKRLSSTISALCFDPTNFSLFLNEMKSLISLHTRKMNTYLASETKFINSIVPPTVDKSVLSQLSRGTALERQYSQASFQEKEAITEGLLENFGMETQDSAQLCKVIKVVKELFEQSLLETSRQNKTGTDLMRDLLVLRRTKSVDALSRDEVKRVFKGVLETEGLQSLWFNTTDFLSTLSRVFVNNGAFLGLLTQRFQSVLESFFLVYSLLYDEEAYLHYRKGRFVSLRESKKPENQGISQLVEGDERNQFDNMMGDFSEYEEMIRERNTTVLMGKRTLESEDMLRWVCEKAKDVLNIMVKQNPRLLRGPISILMRKSPRILDFENKKAYFRSELKKLRRGSHHYLKLRVSRSSLFMDSFSQIINRRPNELRGKLNVEFIGEEGLDAGGVTREWFLQLSREILNPHYALFKPAAHGSVYQPSPQSCVNVDHLKYFKFVGRIIGKALHDGHMLDCYFTRSFYKHILGQPLTCQDMEDIDPEYYKNLKWILDNDINGLDLTFCYEAEEFGEIVIRDLKEGGRNIPVTEHNKKEYVYKICEAKMANDIKDQIQAFLEGFHEIIPAELIQIFDSKELELMITGLPEIDVANLRENTEYHNYTKDSQVIVWLWEILENLDRTHKAAFLQFVTGTSKVPLGGFKELTGMGGAHQKFQIHKSYDTSKLPTAHTCFNQLDLPEYSSKEILKRKLLLAITEGKEGFGFV